MTKMLEGKVAIVTGSGQGIGKGIAIYLARQGAKVITNNRKKGSGSLTRYDKASMPEEDWKLMISLAGDAESTAEIIKAEGGEAIPFFGDVSDYETAERLVNLAVDTWGHIDIVVNNAAGLGSGSICSLDDKTWEYLSVPRLKAAFNMMHFAIPHMQKQHYGRIFNCSSDAWTGLVDNDAYSTSNAGIVGLTWASSKELFRDGITVNAYCPQGASPAHAVDYNAMVRNVEKMTGHAPDPKILKVVEDDHGDPINLGPFIAYLATEEAGYISGEVFGIKSSGKIDRYSYPTIIGHQERPAGTGFEWQPEELGDMFKELLGEGYESHAAKRMW